MDAQTAPARPTLSALIEELKEQAVEMHLHQTESSVLGLPATSDAARPS
jgi:hypothetical protein